MPRVPRKVLLSIVFAECLVTAANAAIDPQAPQKMLDLIHQFYTIAGLSTGTDVTSQEGSRALARAIGKYHDQLGDLNTALIGILRSQNDPSDGPTRARLKSQALAALALVPRGQGYETTILPLVWSGIVEKKPALAATPPDPAIDGMDRAKYFLALGDSAEECGARIGEYIAALPAAERKEALKNTLRFWSNMTDAAKDEARKNMWKALFARKNLRAIVEKIPVAERTAFHATFLEAIDDLQLNPQELHREHLPDYQTAVAMAETALAGDAPELARFREGRTTYFPRHEGRRPRGPLLGGAHRVVCRDWVTPATQTE